MDIYIPSREPSFNILGFESKLSDILISKTMTMCYDIQIFNLDTRWDCVIDKDSNRVSMPVYFAPYNTNIASPLDFYHYIKQDGIFHKEVANRAEVYEANEANMAECIEDNTIGYVFLRDIYSSIHYESFDSEIHRFIKCMFMSACGEVNSTYFHICYDLFCKEGKYNNFNVISYLGVLKEFNERYYEDGKLVL